MYNMMHQFDLFVDEIAIVDLVVDAIVDSHLRCMQYHPHDIV